MIRPEAAERIVDALRAHGFTVRTTAGGRQIAQCPVHGGREPKLSIRQNGNKASVRCYKGCTDADVLAAIEMTVGDLYNEPRGAGAEAIPVAGQEELPMHATEADSEPSPWDGLPLTPNHREILAAAAISPDVARTVGIRSITNPSELPAPFAHYGAKAVPAIAFPWTSPSGKTHVQLRPDVPVEDADGNVSKYLWPHGTSSTLNVLRPAENAELALIVEGTKQGLAAATHAPPTVAVYGVAGCRSWSTGGVPLADLEVFDGKPVVVAFDADLAGNADVHAAAVRLTDALIAEGATTVRYLMLPAGGKAGLDDVLGSRPADRRGTYLRRLIEQAKPKLPAKPARKSKKDNLDGYFTDEGLMVERLYNGITARYPAALTRERRVALYRNGVYHIDGTAFSGIVGELLGDRFRPSHRGAAEEFAAGRLYNAGIFLPERCEEPLLNVRNGMLDLATGTLKPHDPSYLSSTQLAVEWDPDATCPTYEKWLKESVGDQADDLEEVTSTMLDPSRTPTKAVFLFGPSRSGKSTYLRLMQAIAGPENMSAVTLHQLAGNRFAAANVYGKLLNCAADLSSAHVDDVSIFKMMTGEDPVQADRKYGGQFAFTNRALFAFSANELPTVGESSRAYIERVKPFEFGKSFAGREDPTIEARMLLELPGVLARWVRAWQRMTERGSYLTTNARVLKEFETRSDRVRQWVAETCRVVAETAGGVAVSPGATLPPYEVSTKRELAQAFNAWAESNNGSRMGERKIIDRLTSINGVYEVRRSTDKVRTLNVVKRSEADEIWHEDPLPPDLVVAEVAETNHPATRTEPSPHPTGDPQVLDLEGVGKESLAHVAGCAETATSATSWADAVYDRE